MGGEFSARPQGLAKLQAEFRSIQQQFRDLRRAIAGFGLKVDGAHHDLIFDSETGALKIEDSGRVVAQFGVLPAGYNRADGSVQTGFVLYREDGSVAALLGDGNATVAPFKQSFQIADRAGNFVFADDTNSGEGVALPYLTFSTPRSYLVPTDSTTSSTFTTLQGCTGYKMCPRLVGMILVYSSDAATTGEVRITNQDGTQIGSTITVNGADFTFANWGPVALPGHFGDPVGLNFQARRTAGTGTIAINAFTPTGVQSS